MRPYTKKKQKTFTHTQKKAGGEAQCAGPEFKLQYHKKFFLNSGRVAQEVECLPSEYAVLSSNPSTTTQKKII
jgi:hypothetical protein